MKKLMTIMLLLVFIAASYGVYVYINKNKFSMDTVVPDKPLLYIRATNISHNLNKHCHTDQYGQDFYYRRH